MKKLLFSVLFLISFSSFSQLLIPLFDAPQKVERLSDGAEEQTPITFNKGEGMFFNRTYEKIKEDGGIIKAQDIWYATHGKKGWDSPYRAFRDVDGREIKILIGCTRDGERLYLLDRYFEGDSIRHRIVYKTRSGKSTWKDPVEVNIPGIDLSDQQTTLFMHSDEDVLLVSMLAKDTSNTTNEDLYLTYKKEDGSWSELIDLGPNINTKGLEFSPFLTHDKRALYFASNGHEGFGESDIFVSYREEGRWDKWSRPLNLGMPINSTDFESSFVISDTNQVYFSSDRGGNNTDLYFTKSAGTKMANLGILSGEFYKDGKPVAAVRLNAYDFRSEFIESVVTGSNGKFVFKKIFPDDKFEIKLDEEIDEDLSGSRLYLVNQDGKLMKRITFDENGVMTEEVNTDEVVSGVFEQNGSPLLNTAIVVQDENGFPIDTVYTNGLGQFKYAKLSTDKNVNYIPRDLALDEPGLDLYLVDESGNRTATYLGDKKNVSDVFGKFLYKKQPLANAALFVFDEGGNVIDTIMTDAQGAYVYHKLGMDNVSFIPVDQADLEMEDLILEELNEEGTSVNKLAYDKTAGKFTEKIEDNIISGKFSYKNLPLANTALFVFDDNGNVIDTIMTDAKGDFIYNKLGMENVRFSPVNQGDLDMEDLTFETFDKEGASMKILSYDAASGEFRDIEDFDILYGQFIYQKQPLTNTAVFVLDHVGEVINTVYSDPVGVFQYKKLDMDFVSFMPVNTKDLNLDELVLEELDEKGEIKKTLAYDNTTGFYTELVDSKKEEDMSDVLESSEITYINFGFNQSLIEKDSSTKLASTIKMLKANISLTITITGHTDNVGSDDVNKRFSIKRAQTVKNYLVSKGVSSSNIKIKGMGESAPIASNDTAEGRAKNRRVEIRLD